VHAGNGGSNGVSGDEVDSLLLKKASEYATIDGETPTIAAEWLAEFKKSYKL
jgi:hypothetical protein